MLKNQEESDNLIEIHKKDKSKNGIVIKILKERDSKLKKIQKEIENKKLLKEIKNKDYGINII